MKMSVKDRVHRGATLIDCYVPGWEKLINLEAFDINSCAHCILGQVYHCYMPAFVGLDLTEAYDHGFSVRGDSAREYDREKYRLNKEWTRVIRLRLAEQKELSELCAAVEEANAETVSC